MSCAPSDAWLSMQFGVVWSSSWMKCHGPLPKAFLEVAKSQRSMSRARPSIPVLLSIVVKGSSLDVNKALAARDANRALVWPTGRLQKCRTMVKILWPIWSWAHEVYTYIYTPLPADGKAGRPHGRSCQTASRLLSGHDGVVLPDNHRCATAKERY